jgi:alpha-L-fucosidase 2
MSAPRFPKTKAILTLLTAAVLTACRETPVEPPVVAAVTVTSAIDTLVPVGWTAQLTATVTDADGNAIAGAVVSWQSSNAAMATVDANGLLTYVTAGNVTVTATSGGRSGNLKLRGVDWDLPVIIALLNDAYLDNLVASLDPAAAVPFAQAWTTIDDAASQGNITAVQAGLADAQAVVAGSADPATAVFFAVLGLYLDHLTQRLNL